MQIIVVIIVLSVETITSCVLRFDKCSDLLQMFHRVHLKLWGVSDAPHLYDTVPIDAYVLAYVGARSECSHGVHLHHLSVMQCAESHNLFMLRALHWTKWPYVWVSSLWIPHGDRAWQGRIYPWKQMGRKRRREPSSWEKPAGRLLMVERITDVWQCLMSQCSTLSLIDHFHID